jgi:hypothetical protein
MRHAARLRQYSGMFPDGHVPFDEHADSVVAMVCRVLEEVFHRIDPGAYELAVEFESNEIFGERAVLTIQPQRPENGRLTFALYADPAIIQFTVGQETSVELPVVERPDSAARGVEDELREIVPAVAYGRLTERVQLAGDVVTECEGTIGFSDGTTWTSFHSHGDSGERAPDRLEMKRYAAYAETSDASAHAWRVTRRKRQPL